MLLKYTAGIPGNSLFWSIKFRYLSKIARQISALARLYYPTTGKAAQIWSRRFYHLDIVDWLYSIEAFKQCFLNKDDTDKKTWQNHPKKKKNVLQRTLNYHIDRFIKYPSPKRNYTKQKNTTKNYRWIFLLTAISVLLKAVRQVLHSTTQLTVFLSLHFIVFVSITQSCIKSISLQTVPRFPWYSTSFM